MRWGGPSATRTRSAAERAVRPPLVPRGQLIRRQAAPANIASAGRERRSGTCRLRGRPRPAGNGGNQRDIRRVDLLVARDPDRPGEPPRTRAPAERGAQAVAGVGQDAAEAQPGLDWAVDLGQPISASATSGLVRKLRPPPARRRGRGGPDPPPSSRAGSGALPRTAQRQRHGRAPRPWPAWPRPASASWRSCRAPARIAAPPRPSGRPSWARPHHRSPETRQARPPITRPACRVSSASSDAASHAPTEMK